MPRATALLATIALLSGCFGYNHGAKAWSYVGDSLLLVGGGAVIAVDQTTKPPACSGFGCPTYNPPFSGGLVIGAVLVAAGLVGFVVNATRTNVKTSR